MANSGQMTTSNKYIVYRIECTQNSQNIAANTSSVTVRVFVWRTNTGYTTYGSGTCYCKINGTTYSSAITSSQKITNSGIYLFQGTYNIPHNGDGTKTLTMSAWISHDRFSSSEQSYNQTLSTIPRTSSASLNNYNPNFGNTITINISRASGSFTHTVQQDFYAGYWTNIATGVGTSCNWTIPNDYMNRIPNSTSGGGRIRVITYSGSTYIGEVVLNFTANVPSNIIPVVTRLDTSPVGVDVGGYVTGKHQVKVSMAGTWNGGAKYKSVTINVNGTNYNGTSITSNTVWGTGAKTVSTTMTDTRGRTGSKSVSVNFWNYWNPSCSISAFRCNSDGTKNDTSGTYLKITVNGNSCNVGSVNRNTTTLKVQKRATWGSWEDLYTVNPTISGENYNFSNSRVVSGYSLETGYEIKVIITDKWTSATSQVTIGTAFTTIDIKANGKGVAIGKVSERDAFEVGMDVVVKNQLLVAHCASYIANSSNLNNYTTIGDYWNSVSADCSKIVNIPEQIAFYLEVRKVGDLILQKFTTFHGQRIYCRFYADWTSSWDPWFKFNNDGTVSDIKEKVYVEDLNVTFETFFNSLKPTKFIYDEKYMDDNVHLGFVAQDIETSLQALSLDKNFAGLSKKTHVDMDSLEETTSYQINYQEFIPLNTYMIQRLQRELSITNEVLFETNKKIIELEEENYSLKEEITVLKEENTSIKEELNTVNDKLLLIEDVVSKIPSLLDK